jgi:predicted metal-dependent enzyme (double-stranded beta helix superfamily)
MKIHPDLRPLAVAAKAFAREVRTTGKLLDIANPLREALEPRKTWLRAEHRIGDPERYMRHLIYVDPDDDFIISAITWLPGQQSPVHGHYVWCAFGIAEGELTEETFRAPGNLLEPLGEQTLRAGRIAELDLGGPAYHRVSNRSERLVVTLHVYGVAADKLTTGINRIYGED